MRFKRSLLICLGSAIVSAAAMAAPTVTVNSVRQQYPYNNDVSVTYTVAGAEAGYSVKFYATINDVVQEVTLTPAADLTANGEKTGVWTAPSGLKDTAAALAAMVYKSDEDPTPMTVEQLRSFAANTYLPKADAAETYLAKTDAASTYLTKADAGSTYLTQTAAGDYLKSSAASSTYLSKTDAANTYLTISFAASTYLPAITAASTYLTQTAAANAYLAKTDAASTYLTKTDAGSTYLTKTAATETYQPKGEYLTSYTETDPTIASWAKASAKPAYTAAEVGAVPTGRKVAGKELSADVTLASLKAGSKTYTGASDVTITAADLGALTSFTETDPTIAAWAKAANKPTYTAAEVGAHATSVTHLSGDVALTEFRAATNALQTAINSKQASGSYVPTSRKVNNKALSTDISLTAADVGAHATSVTHLSGDVAVADFQTATNALQTAINSKQASGSYVPTSRTVAGKALTDNVTLASLKAGSKTYTGASDVTITAADLGALTEHQSLANVVPTSRKINGVAITKDLTQADLGITAATNDLMTKATSKFAAKATTLSGYGITDAVPTTRTVNGKALSGNITLAAADVSAVPTTRKVAGKALSADVTLAAADVGAAASTDFIAATNALQTAINGKAAKATTLSGYGITDAVPTTRTVNSKALSGNITLAASDVGAVPTTRTINGKALSADITLAAADVSAVPTTRTINGKALSANLTQADLGITAATNDLMTKATSKFAAKATTLSGYGITDAKIANGVITLGSSTITPITSHQSLANYVPTSRTVAGKALTGNVTLGTLTAGSKTYNGSANVTIAAADVGAPTSANFIAATNALQTAINGKQASGSYVTTTRKVAGMALSGDITLKTLTLGSKTYNGSAAVSVTAADLSAPTTAQMNSAIAAATNVVATAANKTADYAEATRSANLASSMHQYMIIDMTTTNKYTVTYKAFPTLAAALAEFNTDTYKTTKMALRFVPSGTYVVGNAGNYNQTFCTMPKGYYIGVFPVTQSQWVRVMQCSTSNASKLPAAASEGTSYPVSYVNMRGKGAITADPGISATSATNPSFCSNVIARCSAGGATGLKFDLPTEMMWEVAARAGTDSVWFFGTSDKYLTSYARCSANSGNSKSAVGTYCPNQWGLYDVYGNVWERCRDFYTSTHPDTSGQTADGTVPFSGTGTVTASDTTYHTYTVSTRGGAYGNGGGSCRSSSRGGNDATGDAATYAGAGYGFRLASVVQ